MERKAYPSDISNEGGFVAPNLTLVTKETPQRDYSLREVFNGLRQLARDYIRLPETLIALHFLAFTTTLWA